MILVDLNQVMISNLMAQLGAYTNVQVDEGLLRHMVLNGLRNYRNKFFDEYGELVICCDDKNYWRKQSFPYYKAHRKQAREESELDWSQIFNCLNSVRDELKEFFPYKHLQVDTAEADDIIGTLCHEYGMPLLNGGNYEKILILSGDKDFMQLQKFANVTQYDPIRKRFLKTDDPETFLLEHILKGDRGDGVPNILSNGDTFVSGGRQKPLRASVITAIKKDGFQSWTGHNDIVQLNFDRNKQLVDLSMTPDYIRLNILEQFEQQPNDRSRLFNYFVQNKLSTLMENISEF